MKWLIAAIFTVLFLTPAEARHHRHHGARHHVQHHAHHVHRHRVRHYAHRRHHVRAARAQPIWQPAPVQQVTPARRVSHRHRALRIHTAEATVVAHPSGCPGRAFCGCGAAVRVFGQPIRSLWLAANWYKFPRSPPAPGTVAVRSHHVFVLEAHINGDVWRVYDANSGSHMTRIHARSISGYTIVNPHT
jgi:hypothetical protein